ncbi:hypothetical protein TIFTF001_017254 [Ficus carica]|uniref:Ribulose bisphosphate carboxylase/oxygenase activase, chloroplastic n=1 Tax=Ficus carica TaxID=3494 RepID=A0AA88AU57_FICCA|nr:hypothetical protein TIFTF001_017254 [Ficus carica]
MLLSRLNVGQEGGGRQEGWQKVEWAACVVRIWRGGQPSQCDTRDGSKNCPGGEDSASWDLAGVSPVEVDELGHRYASVILWRQGAEFSAIQNKTQKFPTMAMAHCNQSPTFPLFPNPNPVYTKKFSSFSIRCSPNSSSSAEDDAPKKKRLSQQSSWEAKDSEGRDYLYRLGKEADNMNIAVGARSGVIDDLFTGNFLGRDSDIVFDYRQKVTRSFEYLQGDYYIAPLFMDKVGKFCKIGKVVTVREFTSELSEDLVEIFPLLFLDAVCHITKNYLAHILNTKVPLILGIWGGKGQGKSFQTELIFQTMGIEPVIMSAGELESERAGEPGKLIRERYRTASQVVQNQVRSFTTFTTPI